MQPIRKHALSDSRLSLNEDRAVTVRNPNGGLGKFSHSSAFAQKGIHSLPLAVAFRSNLFLLISPVFEHFLYHQQEGGWLDRFRKALLRSAFDESDTQFHGSKAGQDHYRNRGF